VLRSEGRRCTDTLVTADCLLIVGRDWRLAKINRSS